MGFPPGARLAVTGKSISSSASASLLPFLIPNRTGSNEAASHIRTPLISFERSFCLAFSSLPADARRKGGPGSRALLGHDFVCLLLACLTERWLNMSRFSFALLSPPPYNPLFLFPYVLPPAFSVPILFSLFSSLLPSHAILFLPTSPQATQSDVLTGAWSL